MADEELVAKVSVEGTDESAAALAAYAAAGKASFEKIDAAAAKAAAGVKASTKAVEGSTQDAGKSLKALGDTKISTAPAANLAGVEQAARKLGTEVRNVVKDLARFAANVTKLGTVAVAAGAGLLGFAASVAKQAGGTSDSLDKQAAAQIASNNASLQGTEAAIGYQSSQRQLLAQLQTGTIDYETYSKSVKKLNDDFRESQIVARQTAAAQDEVKAANERLTKQLADQKAYNALIDKFGGPLLTSLTSLGREVTSLYEQFKQAFGPAIASLLDVINGSLTKNGASIVKFFDDAAAKIKSFVSQNGPAIQKAFDAIGIIVGKVFNGLLDAMPALLDLFNNKLVPAINVVGGILTGLTTIINDTFGTKFTVGVTAAVLAVGYLTGAFKLLTTVLRLAAGTPILAVILLLTVAIVALYFAVDWPKLANTIIGAWQSVVAFFATLPALIGGLFAGLWTQVTTAAQTAATFVTTAWNGLLTFFASLPALVGGFFVALWLLITTGAGIAATATVTAWNAMVAFFAGLPKTIGDFFVALWASVSAGVTAAAQWVIDRWNEALAFFASLPGKIGQVFVDVGTAIQDAFNSAVDAVKKTLSDFASAAMSYIQPIIDGLKNIGILSASSGGGGGGVTQTLAGGGAVRGPGTSTSDSIPAWLSNNEYVVKAKSVAKYGKGFMDAVNSGRVSLQGLQRFAAGGLVTPFTQPRLALASPSAGSGGPTNANRVVNLTIGDQRFENLLAPEDVADRMERYAVARNSSSAGRKPSWVGGSR